MSSEHEKPTREIVEECIADSKTDKPWPSDGDGPYRVTTTTCGHATIEQVVGGHIVQMDINRAGYELNRLAGDVADLTLRLCAANEQTDAANERVRELDGELNLLRERVAFAAQLEPKPSTGVKRGRPLKKGGAE